MTSRSRLLHIVDNVEYARTNCFQHQLLISLEKEFDVVVASLDNVHLLASQNFDSIVCALKQRTLLRERTRIANALGNRPVCVYDQDPWHAYMDDSPYKGAYEAIQQSLNVSSIAVTTQWWSQYMNDHGVKSDFVKMWVLPELCSIGLDSFDRPINVGFIGAVHAHRKQLFDSLDDLGIIVNVQSGGLDYHSYLKALQSLKIYIHSEDSPFMINGEQFNLNVGLWAREIEVCSQGCFSVRNNAVGKESYLQGIETALTYDDVNDVPSIIENVMSMNKNTAQSAIDRTVELIKQNDEWKRTARRLFELGAQ